MLTTHVDPSALESEVQNTSGVEKTFSFLPPHGIKLGVGQTYKLWGDITTAIGNGNHLAARRNYQALLQALDRGDITILKSAAPILRDTTSGAVKQLKLTSGTLGVQNPSFTTTDPDASDSEVPPG